MGDSRSAEVTRSAVVSRPHRAEPLRHLTFGEAFGDMQPAPIRAAALSFLVPGLGQVVAGARRRGLVVALPALAILGTAVVGAALAWRDGGEFGLLDAVLRPEVLTAIVVVDLLALAYHELAILDAWQVARRRSDVVPLHRRLAGLTLAGLVAVTALLHGTVAALGIQAIDTEAAIFRADSEGDEWSIPEPSFEPEPTGTPVATPSPTPSPTPTPSADPSPCCSEVPTPTPTLAPSPKVSPTKPPVARWAKDGRLNLLLVGSDAGPDRWLLRTDTMVVLSVDVKTGHAALFGVPRNLVGVPLPPESAGAFRDGRFPGLLNALYVWAWQHPKQFPGGEARGFRALTGAVQELLGQRLDGAVVVDLRGFVRLVDALDGLWVQVPKRVVDRNYPLEDGSGWIRLDISACCHHFNGRMALAYARTRHQDSDYGRMQRQQTVLLALRRQVDPVVLVPRTATLLKIAKDHLWTTLKRSEMAGLARLAARVNANSVKRVLFVPPTYPSHLTDASIAKIRRVARTIFDGRWPSAPKVTAADRCGP